MKSVTKRNTIIIAILCALVALIAAFVITSGRVSAEETIYKVGSATEKSERLEAESATTTASGVTNAVYASGKSTKYLSTAPVTFDVNIAEAGEYTIKFAYYTMSNEAQAKITVNDETAVTNALAAPGRAATNVANSNTRARMPLLYNHNVTLAAGANTIVFENAHSGVTNAALDCIDLDFIEIYKADDLYLYPVERQQLGLQSVGERIEAEWGIPVDPKNYANFTNPGGTAISGCAVGLGVTRTTTTTNTQNSAATMTYKVRAQKAGKYLLVVSNSGNTDSNGNGITGVQTWSINGVSADLTFDGRYFAGGSSATFESKWRFEVELQEGINEITYTLKDKGINTDWFKIIEISDNFETVIQAEDYGFGALKAKIGGDAIEIYNGFAEEYYPTVVDGYGVEFNATREGGVRIPVTVPTDGYYDIYFRGYTGADDNTVFIQINDGEKTEFTAANSGYISWWKNTPDRVKITDNVFKAHLNEGENTVTFTKGNQFVFLDWFYIMPTSAPDDYVDGKVYSVDYLSNITLGDYEIADTSIATIESGVATALKAGYTTFYKEIRMNDKANYVYRRSFPLEINKINFGEPDLLKVDDTTAKFDGTVKSVSATAPDGWKITYDYQTDDRTAVGSYNVAVVFEHFGYNTVRKDVTLVISKGEYKGSDLIVTDLRVEYDGKSHAIAVNCPAGWSVDAVNNARTNAGDTEVTFTFSHRDYEDVVKSAHIIVEPALYTGNDLVFADAQFVYDGEEHTLTAIYPEDWTVEYSSNSRIDAGTTEAVATFKHINYGDIVKKAYIKISKADYNDDGFTVSDITVTFDGTEHSVTADAPDGWAVSYENNGRTDVGESKVKVTFSHKNYNDIVKIAVLSVRKADYDGNELKAENFRVEYDGMEHSVKAEAPDGWTISYKNNALTEIGETIVEITFSHANYNDVVKSVKLAVVKDSHTERATDDGTSRLWIVLGSVLGGIAIIAAAACVVIFIKKKKKVQ